MGKYRTKLPRGGVSQQVRQTVFIHPSLRPPSQAVSGESSRQWASKVTTVLGPKAREQEIKDSDVLMQEQLRSKFVGVSSSLCVDYSCILLCLAMDAPSRQLLQDIQHTAGVPTMHGTYVIDDHDPMITDPFNQDDSWFDDPDDAMPPPEMTNIVQAARDLRIHL